MESGSSNTATSGRQSELIAVPKNRTGRDQYIRNRPVRDKLDKYPRTETGEKMRSFQEKWFQDRPWLEYFKAIDAALCFRADCLEVTNTIQRFG